MGRRILVICVLVLFASGCSISREQRKILVGYPALAEASDRSVSGQVGDQLQSAARDANTTTAREALQFIPSSVEYGVPRPVIDSVGWVVGIPRRILLWDRRVDNHCVTESTVNSVREYLAVNQLHDVTIRVNQYAPIAELRRLRDNHRVGAGWRYTYGLGHWMAYTMFPGRIWGGDWYNPYTNTVHLYSDVPQLGLVEAAYAQDIASQAFPGTYATAQTLPIVGMWHESKATENVVSYVALNGTVEEQERTKQILYARYGMALGGEVGSLQTVSGLAIGNVYQVIGAVAGHTYAGLENGSL